MRGNILYYFNYLNIILNPWGLFQSPAHNQQSNHINRKVISRRMKVKTSAAYQRPESNTLIV